VKAIKNVTLIDGTGADPINNVTVVINDGFIESITSGLNFDLSRDIVIADAGGRTMLPGLIDCHDHLANFGYDLESRWGLDEMKSLRHMKVAAVLKNTLQTGYTTVRDAAGLDAGFRQAVEQGIIQGPRLQVALRIITPTGGIGDDVSPAVCHNPVLSEPGLPSAVANGPDGMRIKVREMVRAGADVIKFASTGGASSRSGLGPKDMLIGLDEIKALVDEAHGLGRKVMCHALGGPGLRAGVTAGVDSIEHGTYLDEDPDLLTVMADKNIFYIPTFSVYLFHATRGTSHGRQRAKSLMYHHLKSFELAQKSGVKIVTGTDAGGWIHGNNAQEITCFVKAGMTAMDAIVSATSRAAECLGLDNEIGTIQPGKRADLILVDGNPLGDVSILEEGKSVRFVMKSGEVYLDELG